MKKAKRRRFRHKPRPGCYPSLLLMQEVKVGSGLMTSFDSSPITLRSRCTRHVYFLGLAVSASNDCDV